MGKGDNKTRRGKIRRGTYGVSRRHYICKIKSMPIKDIISNDTSNNLNISNIAIAKEDIYQNKYAIIAVRNLI